MASSTTLRRPRQVQYPSAKKPCEKKLPRKVTEREALNAFSVDINEIQQKLGCLLGRFIGIMTLRSEVAIVTDSEEDMGYIYIRLFNHSDLSQLSVSTLSLLGET